MEVRAACYSAVFSDRMDVRALVVPFLTAVTRSNLGEERVI